MMKTRRATECGTVLFAVPPHERRLHARFGADAFQGTLWLMRFSRSSTVTYEPCALLNLSYGGVSFRTSFPLKKRDVCGALIELASPFRDAVLATIRVCWARSLPSSEVVAGARFLQTNKGWIGDEEQVLQ